LAGIGSIVEQQFRLGDAYSDIGTRGTSVGLAQIIRAGIVITILMGSTRRSEVVQKRRLTGFSGAG
jgi:hypothetical protein